MDLPDLEPQLFRAEADFFRVRVPKMPGEPSEVEEKDRGEAPTKCEDEDLLLDLKDLDDHQDEDEDQTQAGAPPSSREDLSVASLTDLPAR